MVSAKRGQPREREREGDLNAEKGESSCPCWRIPIENIVVNVNTRRSLLRSVHVPRYAILEVKETSRTSPAPPRSVCTGMQ